jgi:hypothetical protein
MIFRAIPSDPVTIYYCKANLKTGLTVRIIQGRTQHDCAGISMHSTLDSGPFDAEMIHGNSQGKPKRSGARCTLIVRRGIIKPAEL